MPTGSVSWAPASVAAMSCMSWPDDPRVKVVVSQVGAMDVNQIIRSQTSPEQFAAFEQMTVHERIRHSTEGVKSTSRALDS